MSIHWKYLWKRITKIRSLTRNKSYYDVIFRIDRKYCLVKGEYSYVICSRSTVFCQTERLVEQQCFKFESPRSFQENKILTTMMIVWYSQIFLTTCYIKLYDDASHDVILPEALGSPIAKANTYKKSAYKPQAWKSQISFFGNYWISIHPINIEHPTRRWAWCLRTINNRYWYFSPYILKFLTEIMEVSKWPTYMTDAQCSHSA